MWRVRLENVLLKRVPEGWTFDSNYPRPFARQRWTYLLTEKEKERLAARDPGRSVKLKRIRWLNFATLAGLLAIIRAQRPANAILFAEILHQDVLGFWLWETLDKLIARIIQHEYVGCGEQ